MSREHEGLTSMRLDMAGPRAIGIIGAVDPAAAIELIERDARLVAGFARAERRASGEAWRTMIFEVAGGSTLSFTVTRIVGGHDSEGCYDDELVTWECERSDAFGHWYPDGRPAGRLFPEPDGRVIRLA